MQQEDQKIDLPDLGDERQRQRDTRAQQIERHQKCPPRHAVGERSGDWGDTHIGHHLDGKNRAEDQRRPATRKVEDK